MIAPLMAAETSSQRKIRVVVAKPGLDGHDRGAKIIARALRDESISTVAAAARSTSQNVSRTTEATAELAAMSQRLQGLVTQFRF